MENYSLKSNETIIYRGEVIILPDGKMPTEKKLSKISSELLLTNLNIVLITKTKRTFGGDLVNTEIYAIKSVKIYDDEPQIVRKKANVDIYMVPDEKFLHFPDEKEAKDFTDKAIKLVSGDSKFVRAVKKARKNINETNEALDIDVVEMTKGTVGMVGQVAIAVGSVAPAGTKTKLIGTIASALMSPKKKNRELPNSIQEETES